MHHTRRENSQKPPPKTASHHTRRDFVQHPTPDGFPSSGAPRRPTPYHTLPRHTALHRIAREAISRDVKPHEARLCANPLVLSGFTPRGKRFHAISFAPKRMGSIETCGSEAGWHANRAWAALKAAGKRPDDMRFMASGYTVLCRVPIVALNNSALRSCCFAVGFLKGFFIARAHFLAST